MPARTLVPSRAAAGLRAAVPVRTGKVPVRTGTGVPTRYTRLGRDKLAVESCRRWNGSDGVATLTTQRFDVVTRNHTNHSLSALSLVSSYAKKKLNQTRVRQRSVLSPGADWPPRRPAARRPVAAGLIYFILHIFLYAVYKYIF